MPAPLSCLEALVGLAPDAINSCFPLPDGDTSGITFSSRAGSAAGGVYVSQLAGLLFRAGKGQGDAADDLYTKLANARTQAAQYVRQNITQKPNYAYGKDRYDIRGQLGKAGNGSTYASGAVLPLQMGTAEGGGYRVTGIGLLTTGPSIEVDIRLDGEVVASIMTNQGVQAFASAASGDTAAGYFSSTTELQPLLTQLSTQSGTPASQQVLLPFDGQVHTLSADLPDGVLPLSGQLYCTTGCNSKAPGSFGYSVAQRLPQVNSLTNNAGFLLSVQERCIVSADPLCYATQANDQLADSLAQAVVGMAGYYFLLDLFMNAGYNRYTMLNQEQMQSLGQVYKTGADQHIAYLTSPTGLGRLAHPCYTCLPAPYAPRLNTSAIV